MKIEEGKFYRTRDGRKKHIVHDDQDPNEKLRIVRDSEGVGYWAATGRCNRNDESPGDLIAEWVDIPTSNTEGPVRTVTRQEIIPGTYDGVEVGSEVTGHPQREVMVRIATDHGPMVCMDHDALTRAAAVLTSLADALKASEAPR